MKSKLLRKQMFGILSFELLLIIALGVMAYIAVDRITMEHYKSVGQGAAKFVAQYIDGDTIARYLATRQTDTYYDSVLKIMDSMHDDFQMSYSYVVTPEEEGIRCRFLDFEM